MRTEGVRLVAETDQYTRGVDSAAKSTDNLKASVAGVGRESATTGRKVDDLGGDFRDTGRDAQALKGEIQQVEKSLVALALEFAAAGSAANRVDITTSIRKQRGELRQLMSVEKLLPSPGEVAPVAASFGSRLMTGIGGGMSKVPLSPQLLAAVGGAAVVAAPLLGAALSAAVIGGAGIGGIVGGVLLAARDPRVQEAVAGLSDRVQRRLAAAGQSFVGPTLEGLRILERAVDRVDLEGMLRSASRFVKPLAEGIASAMQDLGEGIAELIDNAGPVIDAIGQGIAEIGRHLGSGLASLADNGADAASSLRLIFGLINGSLDTMFTFVRLLTEAYGIARKLGLDRSLVVWGRLTRSSMDDVAEGGRRVGSGTFGAADGVKALGSASAAAEKPQKALVGQLTTAEKAALGERSAMVALSNQLRAQADPAFALIEAQRALKTAQDRAAEATKKHGKNSDEARTATRQLALAALDMQGKAGALSSTFNGKLSPSMRHTLEAAGLTGKQIDAVAREFRDARKDGDKYAKKYQAAASLTGNAHVSQELARLNAIQQALKSGNPLTAGTINKAMRNVLGPQLNRAAGGPIDGPGTETSDDIPTMLSKNEYVVKASSARKIGRRGMDYLNKYGELPVGYATGGEVRWPYPTTAAQAWVPSQAWAMARVAPPIGHWPSSPGAQRGDSGVWHSILAMVKASGIPYHFGNSYRPGDPKWHGSGRAIDFMGYNQNRLANFFMARQSQVLELIHRTNSRDYGITRGHYNAMPTQWPLHRNHLHIAMAGGGVIREPVVGVGASGTTYSLAENGPETVTPGLPQYTTAGGGMSVSNVTNVYLTAMLAAGTNEAEHGRQLAQYLEKHFSNGGQIRVNGQVLVGVQ